MRRTFVTALVILLLAVGVTVAQQQPTSSLQIALVANTSGCYGASCHSKNPSRLCDDGITVASKAVVDGMLELRYSPSCKSNWGRYTPYWNTATGYTATGTTLHARVTAWNPNGPSVNSAHSDTTWYQFGTSWSQMVDGTKAACTGVELRYSGEEWKSGQTYHNNPPTGWDDKLWQWGPCY